MLPKSAEYRENAANAAEMASTANRYKRMEAAWAALAEEQDWLDGKRESEK
jgi:hypothetical protein